jgi:hypothetical protein
MPTEYLDQNGLGVRNSQWSKVGGAATKWEAVLRNSGQTSYLQATVDGYDEWFVHPGTSSPILDNSVTDFSVWSNGYTGNPPKYVNFFTYDGASQYNISVQFTGTPTDRQSDHTASTTWSEDKVNGSSFEWAIGNASGSANYIYETWMEITYSEAGGSCFIWMSWLPPILLYGLPLFGAALLSESDKLAEWMGSFFRKYRYYLDMPLHPKTGKPHVLYPALSIPEERELFWNCIVKRPVYNI